MKKHCAKNNPRALTGLEIVYVPTSQKRETSEYTVGLFSARFQFKIENIFKCVLKAVKNTQ